MKFYIYTLGCKVNTYESNVIRDLLEDHHYVASTSFEDSDLIIINTCSVTNTADNKSKKMTRHARKVNPKAILVVMGCFSQISEEVKDDLSIDIVLGNKDKSKLLTYIEKQKKQKRIVHIEDLSHVPFEPMKLKNFNQTRAFVKIEDGCENFCSYCIIPYTRGPVRSKPASEVLDEIQTLVTDGHKEIVLTGIHTGHYQDQEVSFADLLKQIIKIPGLKRLRISSIEMNEITKEVLEILKESPILVDHFHIPLQSGSEEILKKMNRKYTKQEFINKIKEIRTIRPDISITTDVIVGFPGETEELFEETLQTIKEISFAKIHVFPYSQRKGTEAAVMKNQIPNEIKKQRVKTLLEVSKQLEIEYMQKFLQKEISFLPETYKDGYVYGHTGNYLYIKMKGNKQDLNKETMVFLTEENYPYLFGEKVS